MPTVTLYSKPNCPLCDQARYHLAQLLAAPERAYIEAQEDSPSPPAPLPAGEGSAAPPPVPFPANEESRYSSAGLPPGYSPTRGAYAYVPPPPLPAPLRA